MISRQKEVGIFEFAVSSVVLSFSLVVDLCLGKLSTNAFKEGRWRWFCWHTSSQWSLLFHVITWQRFCPASGALRMLVFNGHIIHVCNEIWKVYRK